MNNISRTDFDEMWSELHQQLHQLADAWHDRHHISGKGIAALLLQYSATFAFHTRVLTLDDVLSHVKKQWTIALAELLPKKDGTK